MPIRLNDVATVRKWEPDPGVSVSYRHAKSGEVLAAIRDSMGADGKVDMIAVDSAVIASCVVGWEGFESADGAPLPWPDDPAMRRSLLDALPWNVLVDLKGHVFAAAQGATDSGKG